MSDESDGPVVRTTDGVVLERGYLPPARPETAKGYVPPAAPLGQLEQALAAPDRPQPQPAPPIPTPPILTPRLPTPDEKSGYIPPKAPVPPRPERR